jgi:hypothetical protein
MMRSGSPGPTLPSAAAWAVGSSSRPGGRPGLGHVLDDGKAARPCRRTACSSRWPSRSCCRWSARWRRLVGQGHQQRAADAGLQVLFGRVFGQAGKLAARLARRRRTSARWRSRRSARPGAGPCRAHRSTRCRPCRAKASSPRAPCRRPARRRPGQHQGRVDAARQADDGAREAVLAQVVAHAGDQRRPGLGFQRGTALDRARTGTPPASSSTISSRRRRLAPARATSALASTANDAPSNTTSSCPPTRWAYSSGRPVRARALGHARFALAGLVEVEGRRVQHAQHLRAGVAARPAGSSNQASSQISRPTAPRHLEHQRRQPGVAAGHEVAPLVEDLVVGQFALAVGGQHRPPASTEAALKRCCTGQRLGPNIAALTQLMRMPHHHMQARQSASSPPSGQGLGAGLHEGRAQQQVFGRVAAEPVRAPPPARAPGRGPGGPHRAPRARCRPGRPPWR